MVPLSRGFYSSKCLRDIVVQQPHTCRNNGWFGLFPRSLATTRESLFIFFSYSTKMLSVPALVFHQRWMTFLQNAGLSHSEISGSKVICTYPRLIAAYHVLQSGLREQGIRHAPLLTILSNLLFKYQGIKYQ